MNGFVEISTLLIHSAPKQKSNEWMHLSPFYTHMHGKWLRYAKSTSQFHWRFLFSQRCSGLPGKSPISSRHNVSVPSIRERGLRTYPRRCFRCIVNKYCSQQESTRGQFNVKCEKPRRARGVKSENENN